MKSCCRVLLLAFMVMTISACDKVKLQNAALPGAEIRRVFAGMTPCGDQAKQLFQIPGDNECDQMIWNLVLRQDPQTGIPTTYSLKTSYGLSKQGTNDLIDGGTTVAMDGKWRMETGTQDDPDAIVYQLNPAVPQETISFLMVSDDLIHVLSGEKAMLVGNGAWAYTLVRMGKESPAQSHERPWWSPNPPTRPPAPPMPTGSAVFGVFDGRTPCHPVAMEFTDTGPADCVKIKWRLTLYQDSITSEPSRYLYMGTRDYGEGSWKTVHGMPGDPNALLYQLQPDGAQQSFSFLKLDDNHLFLLDRDMKLLVGNEFFSYTLSRNMQSTQ